jgi:hypothetical protein
MVAEQKTKKNPFSPLQTGCAFIMLTNMLIYLAVMAFVLNLLDPSKLEADYLAKRGFTTPRKESAEDREFRMMAEDRREELRKQPKLSLKELKTEPTPAQELSKLPNRAIVSGRPEETPPPSSALTYDITESYKGYKDRARSRIYSLKIFPKVTIQPLYHAPRMIPAKNIPPERYDTIAVELAPGIEIPMFTISIPSADGNATYTPPDPVLSPTRGGPRIKAPEKGAESIESDPAQPETSGPESEPVKDTL